MAAKTSASKNRSSGKTRPSGSKAASAKKTSAPKAKSTGAKKAKTGAKSTAAKKAKTGSPTSVRSREAKAGKSRRTAAKRTQARSTQKQEQGALSSVLEKAADLITSPFSGPSRTRKTNAIDLLKTDHDRVDKLFKRVKASEETAHPQIFKRIKAELDVHAHIEEAVFYPKLLTKGDKDLADIVREGIQEHLQVKRLLKEIDGLTSNRNKFEAKLKVLIENVEHHVQEEENEMFPLVKSQFDAAMLDEMASQMEKEKAAFKKPAAKRSAKSGR